VLGYGQQAPLRNLLPVNEWPDPLPE
jgi:hypothetical protein